MSQPIEEQLSSLMDGELGRDETRFLLRRVESDGELARRWTRYHVGRQVLRRQEIVALRADFTSIVMARIDSDAGAQAGRHAWLRWGSGGAIAAAVAVAALMVTKPANQPEVGSVATAAAASRVVATAPAPASLASAASGLVTPLVPNSPIQTTAASFGSDLTEPASFDPRMESYLIRHYQATGLTGQPDFVPYILLAQPAQTIQARPADNR
jgi:sigma-E factor negative regulatory protein RseA